MKKIMLISYGKLILNGMGDNTVMVGMTEAILRQGYSLKHVCLTDQDIPQSEADEMYVPDVHPERLEKAEIFYQVKPLGRSIKNVLVNNMDWSYNQEVTHVPEGLYEEEFDLVIAFHYLAVEVAKNVNAKQKLVITGDPPSRRMYYSTYQLFGLSKIHLYLLAFAMYVVEPFYWRKKISDEYRIAQFGKAHSDQWASIMGKPVIDLRPMIPDNLLLEKEKNNYGNDISFAFGGTLGSTASRMTKDFFIKTLIPALQSELSSGYLFNVIGNMTDDYKKLLDGYANIKLSGRVPNFEKELESVDLFILPMKYPVGVRTRVCSALYAGCFCLCDETVLQNMPELADCKAIKILTKDEDYVSAIRNFPRDVKVRKELSRQAREFFQKHYSSGVATAPIFREIFGE